MRFAKTSGWCSWSRGGRRKVHGVDPTSTKLLALRETQPCGLKRTCNSGAAEALRASPAPSLRPAHSQPLSTVGGERQEASDTINPKNQPSVKAG